MDTQQFVFFSGGTAFNITSSMLAQYTENATYIVTTFDSGGSTGVLRSIVSMPAVGDIRKRMLALANPSCDRTVFNFLSFRASRNPTFEEIDRIYTIMYREHAVWKVLPKSITQQLACYMDTFLEHIPLPFSFSQLSLGNCIIVGAMFYHGSLYEATQSLANMLGIRGIVLPITEEDVHLVGIAHDGTEYIGQRAITTQAQAPFTEFFLATVPQDDTITYIPTQVQAPHYVMETLRTAGSICYPMGSFYSSILACLLVEGVGESIAKRTCPKIYIPNIGVDIEQGNMSVATCVDVLLDTVGAYREHAMDYITHILLDKDTSVYVNGVEQEKLPQGIELVYIPHLATTMGTAPEKIIEFFINL